MATEIYLVKVGMTMTEGMVEEWYIPDGGHVEKGQLLYRLETEKVNLDVDADTSGIVRHKVAAGVTMAPGDVIGMIYAPGEAQPSSAPARATTATAAAPRLEAQPAPARAPATASGERAPASPAARRLARELGIEIATLAGTGPGGRIVEGDIRAAAERTGAEGAGTARPTAGEPAPTGSGRSSAPVARASRSIPVKGMRKTIAARMHQSLQSTAQLTMDMDVVMDDAVRLREQLGTEWAAERVKPTYTDLVVRAVAKALAAHPTMNSRYGDNDIALLDEIHIGVAVALDAGLVVPVIRDAANKPLKALAIESAALAARARGGELGLDEMAGGTFTVSALGMYGVDAFTPILNSPQTGILGVNRIRDDVAWIGDRAAPQKRMRLSLTWDHRVLDGAPAAQFLAAVRDLLEAPYRLLV